MASIPGLNKQAEEKFIWGDLNPADHPEFHVEWSYVRKGMSKDYLFSLKVKVKTDEFPARTVVNTANLNGPGVIENGLKGLAKQVAPRLFEKDPRIGIRVTEAGNFPRSPLFDRFDYDPKDIALRFRIQNLFEPFECPFCQMIMDGKSIWCGGNVGFAHIACADWVVTPPSWYRD